MQLAEYRNRISRYGGGQGVPGLQVWVRPVNSAYLAAVYADPEGVTLASNPLRTDDHGRIAFWAVPGAYTLTMEGLTVEVTVGGLKDAADMIAQVVAEFNQATRQVHGIADTQDLETRKGAQARVDAARGEILEELAKRRCAWPAEPPSVTGSREDGTALGSLVEALARMGLVVDRTTA